MIKLRSVPIPPELTEERKKTLTDEYKVTEKAVWQKDFICDPLLEMTHGKCCFSECKLNEEGKYDEVEHFHPKSLYPDEVVSWDNLLPINKACNIAKGDHDTKAEPIINPRFDDPKIHLYFKGYRFYPKTELGKKTIDVVGLNDWTMWVTPRFEIGKHIIELLESILDQTRTFFSIGPQTVLRRNRLLSRLRGLMIEGTEKYAYSATVATVLLNEECYQEIKSLFEANGLWSDELQNLEDQISLCALDITNK
ncbi:HNH endonuclease [Larkinella terrae]|uniref:HNH endonuclease n=1 Tax=Larkinella terrae TaxID=2025311 RepID=A0A7K0ENV6_9BACT|nr:HNH endonuclease [Larkinella terrae]MRS63523.1 HNH endonuclease [Larkinella terrae]